MLPATANGPLMPLPAQTQVTASGAIGNTRISARPAVTIYYRQSSQKYQDPNEKMFYANELKYAEL
jgi:hypothetical protein